MYPSIATLMQIKDVTASDARAIRAIMVGPGKVQCEKGDRVQWPNANCEACWYRGGHTRMERIDAILRTHGVEYIPRGRNAKSPAIYYCNTGDTYATTVLKVNGAFRVGCWGDIVERGNYE